MVDLARHMETDIDQREEGFTLDNIIDTAKQAEAGPYEEETKYADEVYNAAKERADTTFKNLKNELVMSTVKLGKMHYNEKDGKGIFGKFTKNGVVMTERQKGINERAVNTLTQNISAQILSSEFKEKFDTRDVATNLYHVKPTTFAKIASKMSRLLTSV